MDPIFTAYGANYDILNCEGWNIFRIMVNSIMQWSITSE